MNESWRRKILLVFAAGYLLVGCNFAQAAGPQEVPLAGDHLLRITMGLVLVLLAIGVTAWLMRQFFRIQPGMHGQLRILSGVSMGPRERVVLLEVGETQLLVGVAPGRIQTLHVLATRLEVPEIRSAPGSAFARVLARRLAHSRDTHA